MTTTTEPTADRRDDDQPEQQHREVPATADAHLGGIDEAIAAAEASARPEALTDENSDGDPLPDSLLAALKTLLPPYAFFDSQSRIPGVVKSLAKAVGAEAPEVTAYQVAWTSGEAGWQQPGVYQVGWMRSGCLCGDHPDKPAGYRLEINAPGITIDRDGLTTEQAIDVLRSLRLVR